MWHSLWRYQPRIGYTYMPSVRSRVPFDGGGYLVSTNADGFRSDCEFVEACAPGTFRAILFGDSQTAGDGVANADRFSDVLARLVPRLEVFNYGLTGSGTDQQYLTYLECSRVDHDLLIIGLYVENIRRVNHRLLQFRDENGDEVFYAKPYYQIEDGRLVLHQVPVPRRPWTATTLPAEHAGQVDRGASIFPGVQAALRRMVPPPALAAVKKFGPRELVQKVTRFQPVPEYDSPQNPSWLLLRTILETWIHGSRTPVLLVPIPMWMFIDGQCDPSKYQARFRELARDSGCSLHDPLPDLQRYTPEERRTFRFKHDTHLSARGHDALGRSLAPAVERIIAEGRNQRHAGQRQRA
jgi:hypothetical protein